MDWIGYVLACLCDMEDRDLMASPFYNRARRGGASRGQEGPIRAGAGRAGDVCADADEMQGPSVPVRRDACAARPREGDTYVRVESRACAVRAYPRAEMHSSRDMRARAP